MLEADFRTTIFGTKMFESLKTRKGESTYSPKVYKFRAKIDRIEKDKQSNVLVLDYKTGKFAKLPRENREYSSKE